MDRIFLGLERLTFYTPMNLLKGQQATFAELHEYLGISEKLTT